jgi:3-hydroxyacyl-CoA dehydrogenase
VMRLLEVVQAEKTAPDVLKTAIETGKALRKLPVTVGVCHGFVGNRMLHARFGQVEALLLEGASPSEIDAAMTRFGFAMGPCAVSDLAGLDVGWRARVEAGRTAIVADAICRMGRFGQKTGAGYYRYRDGSRRGAPDVEIDALIAQLAEENGIERRQVPQTEIFERLVYSLINEGARILEEGIARRASDIDLIWVNGYGWPAYEGGPMFYADRIGPGVIARRLERHAQATGYDALLPAPLLLQLAREGGSLTQD